MSEYIETYSKQEQSTTTDVPSCVDKRRHCWHVDGHSSNATGVFSTLMRPAGFDQTCCWCGWVKHSRPNPEAHGPHDPRRRSLGQLESAYHRNVWNEIQRGETI